MVSPLRKITVVLATAFAIHASCMADQLKIAALESSYAANAPISFTVVKEIPGAVTFCVASEILYEGRWRDDRWDIFSHAYNLVVRRDRRLDGPSVDLRWDIPHLLAGIRPEAGRTYRLRVDVLTPKKEQIFSPPFAIRTI